MLWDQMAKCKEKKRIANRQVLVVPEQNVPAFLQMVEYLYTGNFKLDDGPGATHKAKRMMEFLTLMETAKNYNLPGLQDKVAAQVKAHGLFKRLTPAEFFDWCQKMLAEESHREIGAFSKLFDKFAPEMLTKCIVNDKKVIRDGIGGSNTFEAKMFKAAMNVSWLSSPISPPLTWLTSFQALIVATAEGHAVPYSSSPIKAEHVAEARESDANSKSTTTNNVTNGV